MPTPVAMPKLGMSMEEGTVVSWLIAPGQPVERGSALFVMESDKAEVEVEATASGYLRHVYVAEGETVPCGTLVGALTDTPDEELDVDAFRAEHDRPRVVVKAAAPPAVAAPRADAPRRPAGRTPVAPAARKLARELDIDPAKVAGTGPGGRVTRQDVEAYAAAREALIDVGGGVSLDVPRQGAGEPVLLLPGFGTDVSAFARQLPALSEGHEILGVNPRGVGLSDAPELPSYAVAQAAADAAAVADGPLHLIGTSAGASVALELALARPERVRSLALIAPLVTASPRLLAVMDAWVRLAGQVGADLLARALLPWFFSAQFLAEEAARERTVRGLAQTVARVAPGALARTAAGLIEWSGTRQAELSRLSVPTLVIVAGADLLTPDGDEVAKSIPGARCVRVEGAGHAVGLEAPGPVNRALLEHLQGA